MAALEVDISFRTTIESLLQIANIRLEPVLQCLLSSLEGLSRVGVRWAIMSDDRLIKTAHVGQFSIRPLSRCLTIPNLHFTPHRHVSDQSLASTERVKSPSIDGPAPLLA